ncbi:helix-turn-helix domain protein [[Leptolyngbya] sp. PCC 7376]|nr:helix-turn-helix domain protein [[Leptolyngbya] sp. PCC 7376]
MRKKEQEGLESTEMTTFKAYLKSRNIKQNDIAELLGVTHQRVSTIVTGKTPPSLQQVITIAQYLGISTDELIKLLEL